MTYSEEQVNDLLDQLLVLRSTGPVFNVQVRNGQLRYRSCIPNRHQIRDHHGEIYDVTAADDTVIIGVHAQTKVTKIFYPHELGHLNIIEKPAEDIVPHVPETLRRYAEQLNTDDGALPALCGIYTHHTNSISYLVYGFTNESSRDDKRDEYPVLVHYVGQNGKTWSKTVKRFNQTMIAGGKFQFNEDAGFKYLGIVENDQIVNGWLTKELSLLMNAAKDSDNDTTED